MIYLEPLIGHSVVLVLGDHDERDHRHDRLDDHKLQRAC